VTLDSRITEFATLVALIFVLITLFTGQRAAAIVALRAGARTTRSDVITELFLDTGLALATVLLFLIGVPLFLEAIRALHPLRNSGPLRGGFIVTWLMLLGVIVWQLRTICLACEVLRKFPKRPPTHGGSEAKPGSLR
jgi:hypothetical protein